MAPQLFRLALPLLLVACGVNSSPPASTATLSVTPRYLDLYPGSQRTFDVHVAPDGPMPASFTAANVPAGVTVAFQGSRGTVTATTVNPGAYPVIVQGSPSGADVTGNAGWAVLNLYVPLTGHILNEPPRPHHEELTVDASQAVEATISPAGSHVTLSDAQGTTFDLTVPPGAVLEERTVRLTPVQTKGVGGSNASYALQLLPADLHLYKGATLQVLPPGRPENRGLFVGWKSDADGHEFLYTTVKVISKQPNVTVRGGGVHGVAWIDGENLDPGLVPTRRDDQRVIRLWRSPDPESMKLAEQTYWVSLLNQVGQPNLTRQAVERLLPEVAMWADDLQNRPYEAPYRGNVGLVWSLLADAALANAESYQQSCPPDEARAVFRRWFAAAELLPAWREALGPSGVQTLRAVATCQAHGGP